LASLIESRSATWDPLVPVHPTGSRVPLFAVHGGDGDVLYARLLSAYLGPDQPLYGLRGATISGRPTTEKSLPDLAATYMTAIRHVRPTGPYYLFGYSVGGLIAFDMARQLEAAGEQVGLVVLGDSSAPGSRSSTAVRRLSVAERVRLRGEEVRDLGWRRGLSHLAHVLGQSVRVRIPGYVPPHERERALIEMSLKAGTPVPPFARETFGVKHYGHLAAEYRPTDTYSGRVVLVRSADSSARGDLGWSEFAPHLSVLEISGGHQEMVQRQYIRELADHLRKQLAEVASP
jgi:thioesterase domain-containing protein